MSRTVSNARHIVDIKESNGKNIGSMQEFSCGPLLLNFLSTKAKRYLNSLLHKTDDRRMVYKLLARVSMLSILFHMYLTIRSKASSTN